MQIKPVAPRNHRVLRHREVQHNQPPPLDQNTPHLKHCQLPISHVSQPERHCHQIERRICKRERQGIRLHKSRDPLPFRLSQHRKAKIRCRHFGFRTCLLQSDCQIPTSRGQIKYSRGVVPRPKSRHPESPQKIQPAAQKMVRDIVARRNRRKRGFYKPGILLLQRGIHWDTPTCVLTRGLEPPRVTPYDPESYASASSAT